MEKYPLHWPAGYKRTQERNRSQFKQTMEKAQQFLHKELERLKASDIIVSSNIPVRKDGLFYTDWMNRKIEDPGVAVYFKHKGKDRVLCCDTYSSVWENTYAIGKTIEALRAIDRYGVADFLDRAFTGFTAIPESIVTDYKPWYQVLELQPSATEEEIKKAYITLSKKLHPDNLETGSTAEFQKLYAAYNEGLVNVKNRDHENH